MKKKQSSLRFQSGSVWQRRSLLEVVAHSVLLRQSLLIGLATDEQLEDGSHMNACCCNKEVRQETVNIAGELAAFPPQLRLVSREEVGVSVRVLIQIEAN